MKKILLLSLAGILMFSGLVMAKAEDEPVGFIREFAEIEEVNEEGKYTQILVNVETNEEDAEKKLYLYTTDVPVMDLKTGEFAVEYKFEKGQRIQYFFKENTPMMMSYPGKMTPDFIGINVDDAKYSLDVDYFDKDGQGKNNRLKLNLSDDLVGVTLQGEEVKDFLEKDLAVLYTVATRSLPPIAKPDKIFVLEIPEKVVSLEDYKAEDGQGYFLRKYYEALGAEVKWDEEKDLTTITMGEKSIMIDNPASTLKIEDKDVKMENFSIVDGVSFIQEEYIKMINDFLM